MRRLEILLRLRFLSRPQFYLPPDSLISKPLVQPALDSRRNRQKYYLERHPQPVRDDAKAGMLDVVQPRQRQSLNRERRRHLDDFKSRFLDQRYQRSLREIADVMGMERAITPFVQFPLQRVELVWRCQTKNAAGDQQLFDVVQDNAWIKNVLQNQRTMYGVVKT